ncbi:MAG: hypothetical protein EOP88_19545 [Verrucomicrobiaceae bacterium]|nr:MAG: hypothetical protein EOP88_19545 [Verrucomicrobiaceae bacterium]
MKITENGATYHELIPGRTYALLAAGYFGGGTLEFTLADGVNGGVPIPGRESTTVSTAFRFVASAPFLVLYLENATAPSFTVDFVLCPC